MEHLNILLCEDERLFAMELKDRLQSLGHHVTGVASNGIDALKLAEKQRPDLALMDIRLDGDLTGIDVASIFRAKFDLPSIFLTAYGDSETVEKARPTNPLGFLVKPVHDRELKMAIEFGVAQHRVQQKLKGQLDNVRLLAESLGVSTQPAEKVFTDSEALDLALVMGELGQLIGGVAHHFNNSLAVVDAHLRGLLEGQTLNDYERRQVMRALEGCDRQRVLVKRLSWASQSGPRTLEILKVQDVLQKALEDSRSMIRSNISCNIAIDREPIQSLMDREAVADTIKDLLFNAQEAIDGKGEITISLSCETESNPEQYNSRAVPGEYAVVTITDNGRGIPEEEQKRIFEPFFTTHQDKDAAGLGLSVAYGVAQSHGGWVTLASREGGGSTIKLFFPRLERQSGVSRTKMGGGASETPGT